MTTTPDARRIAEGLTEAQAELCREGGGCVRAYKPAQELVELGLWVDDGDKYQLRPIYSDLGRQVRAILQEQHNG